MRGAHCPQRFCAARACRRPFAGLRAAQPLACRARGTSLPPMPPTARTDRLRPHRRTQVPSPGRRASSLEAPERAAARCLAAVATVARGGMRARAGVASGTNRGHGGGVRGARRHGRAGPHRGVAAVFDRSAIVSHRAHPAGRGAGRDVGRWEPPAAPGRLLLARGRPGGGLGSLWGWSQPSQGSLPAAVAVRSCSPGTSSYPGKYWRLREIRCPVFVVLVRNPLSHMLVGASGVYGELLSTI
jgi:hypothetical protein